MATIQISRSKNRLFAYSLLLITLFVLPILACSLSNDRSTIETSATAIPEIRPTDSRSIAATPTQAQIPTLAVPAKSPTPKPQINLEVGSFTNYQSSIGGLYIVGEILNKGNSPAWRVQVAISLIDSSGNVVGVGSVNLADMSVTPANGKYPFLVLISKAPNEWKEVKIQVQGEPYTGSSIFPPYLDLKAESVTGKNQQFGGYTLSGKVTNTGSKTAELVKIVAVAYDENSKVVDVGWTYSTLDQIQSGGNAPFELDFRNLKAAPSKYEVLVQGREKK